MSEETHHELEDGLPVSVLLAILRRRAKTMFIVAAILAAMIVPAVFLWPAYYESTATILIEQQEIPRDLVQSTVTTYANQQLQIIQQRVMTSANLLEVISKYALYEKERKSQPVEAILARMVKEIGIEPLSAKVVDPRSGRSSEATIAFTVSYRNRSPQLAQRVANELTSLFLNENLRRRTELTEETSVFLDEESRKLAIRVEELEAQLAEFKERHGGALPEYDTLNRQFLDRTERDIKDTDRLLRTLEERRIFLQAELARLRHAGLLSPSMRVRDERLATPAQRLQMLRSEYSRASALYSPEHPDVVRLRRELEALNAQAGGALGAEALGRELEASEAALVGLKERYAAEHPDVRRMQSTVDRLRSELDKALVTPSGDTDMLADPVLVQLEAQLKAVDAETTSLGVRRRQLEDKLADYESRIIKTPQVEREYLLLTRDHTGALREYEELKAKQLKAELAQALESERKGERFTLIEPPQLPEVAVSPNRRALLLLGLVFAVGTGAGSGALSEILDGSVRDRRDLDRLVPSLVLGVIPEIETAGDVMRRRMARGALAIGILGLAVAGLWAVHNLVMPIDTLWYVLMRRLGVEAT